MSRAAAALLLAATTLLASPGSATAACQVTRHSSVTAYAGDFYDAERPQKIIVTREVRRLCDGRFTERYDYRPPTTGSQRSLDVRSFRAVIITPSAWRGRTPRTVTLRPAGGGVITRWAAPWRSSSRDTSFGAAVKVDIPHWRDDHAVIRQAYL